MFDHMSAAEYHALTTNLSTPKKPSKYRAVKTQVDDRTFDSKAEAKRYQELCLLVKAGEITNLACQVRYPLVVNEVKIATYVADFSYQCGKETVVEDTKGFRTDIYKLKKKLMKALYGIEILETT